MIKYLGSKRTLIPALQRIISVVEPRSAVDVFTGTTRVACAMKSMGVATTANDIATYSKVLADCYIATDARDVDRKELQLIIDDLAATAPSDGYFTETFCRKARFFQPHNGARIDAIRERIEMEFSASPYYPILLTSLMEAADRVDSTTGQQMAYLKQWAARSYNDLQMRIPQLLDGPGQASRMDANEFATSMPPVDLAYLDPPYNQHRYFTNYHIWETLIRWDKPETYGVAQKRVDAREGHTKSAYNRKREMPPALFSLINDLNAATLVLSYNDESWIDVPQMVDAIRGRFEELTVLGFDNKRYVGAQIGIYDPEGQKVGKVGRLRNIEYVFVAGTRDIVRAVNAAMENVVIDHEKEPAL